ncbi:unnamed protein product [Rhizophagus irregularis]|nr:unnamed protein product [Rhizophagus irregularis]
MANFNAQDSNTSFAHSKDTAWKIKTSINTLPTLDILNRNFPDLIQNKTTCLMSTFTQLAYFNWIYKDLPPSVEAILLIRSYVTHDLFRVLKLILIPTKTPKKHL